MARANSPRTYTAGEELLAHRRVKLKLGTVTTPPEVEYADAGESHIGMTLDEVDAGALLAIKLRNHPGTHEMTAGGAFAINVPLYGADDGKISTTVVGDQLATSHEAATGDGDIVEVLPFVA